MKIFQVLNSFLPQQTAGTEVYTWALSKQLQELGHELKIIIPNYGKAKSEDYVYDDLPVHKFEETSIMDRNLIMGFKDSNGLEVFTQYVNKMKPDIVHFHEITSGDGITLKHISAAKNSGAKIIFTFHLADYICRTGTLFYKEKILCDGKINIVKCSKCYLNSKGYEKFAPILNPLSQFLYTANINSTRWNNKIGTALGTSFLIDKQKKDLNRLIGDCSTVVTLTEWYKRILLLNNVPNEKIVFISQGLPLNNFPEQMVDVKKSNVPLRLIFLGRVSNFKGLHLLIDAVMQISPKYVSLNIFGQSDGTDYEKLLKAKTKNFDSIKWCGKLEQKLVLKTLQQNDVLCLCSTFSEMSPLVIQEAFAAGVPVLASNVYGNAEQIQEGENGWLFKFNDAENLKLKIQHILDRPEEVLEIKEKLKKHLVVSFEIIAKKYETIYKKVTNEIA